MPHKQMAIHRVLSAADGASHTPMLAIAGDSAAGKTTLTRGIASALGAERITSVCVDDYHRYDRTERRSLAFTPLHPDCNYLEVMEQHLQLLSLGQPVLKPVYDHHDGSLGRPVLVTPSEFVVVEGLFPLHSKLARACFDVTVFLDPPESVRRRWKLARDTSARGYSEAEVLAELDRREPDSAAYIRPQRQFADIVIRFAPIAERHESDEDPPSATILLRPTIAHPDFASLLSGIDPHAVHLKLARDADGRPVDALHIHAYAARAEMAKLETAIWEHLAIDEPFPCGLGELAPGNRSEPLALAQLILLYHLFDTQR
jgi:phosphoribulokinase